MQTEDFRQELISLSQQRDRARAEVRKWTAVATQLDGAIGFAEGMLKKYADEPVAIAPAEANGEPCESLGG